MPKKYTKRADGYYSTRVYLGTVDGKKKYKQIYGKTTKEVAQTAWMTKEQIRELYDTGKLVHTLGYFFTTEGL